MEFVNISNLNQKVMRIGLGTWAIGGWMWGGSDEKQALATIHQALDAGINLLDTAPVYGFGTSEEIVGKALKAYGKRDKIIVATKVGLRWQNEKINRNSSKRSILEEVENSLTRLQIDYIDLYQVHWPDINVSFKETAEILYDLQKQGKIRAIGVSNFSVEQMTEFKKYAPLDVLQSPFNLFEREIEASELPFTKKNHIATLGYGSICRGLLTGKLTKDSSFKGDDLRKNDPKFKEPRFSQYLKCVDRLQSWVSKKHQKPLIALAVRWVLDSGIDVALWGARNPEQLQPLRSIWGWKLSKEDLDEIDHILKETIKDPVGPEFMAPPI